ncbi:MAG: flagellar filament capping protein FliD [Eubacterium sp.]|nr:flagellar filament capping protein FliD [Eubacterium sp.]
MAIRITGMYSGLDTESIISELASAQSYKKTKLVKEQKRLSWKQDAWKSLNTKLYSFYQKLDDLRMQSSYMKKKTISSNPNAVSVVSNGNAVEGIQSISVTDLARSGYLTGGELKTTSGAKATGSTTLEQLGFTGTDGSISVNTGSGTVKIDVTKDTTIDQFVKKLSDAGLNASFDANYQRLYVSSKETGELANFTLTGDNAAGMNVLESLGLLSMGDKETAEYNKWAAYKDASGNRTAAYEQVINDEIAKRAAAYKAQNDKLTAENEALAKKNEEAKADYEKNYQDYPDADHFAGAVSDLKEKLYGHDEDQVVDGETKKVHVEGELEKKVSDTKKALEDAQNHLKELKDNGASAADIADAEKEVTEKSQAASEAQSEFNTAKGKYSYLNAIDENNKKIAENEAKISTNESKFSVDGDGKVTGTSDLRTDVETEFDKKVDEAQAIVADKASYASKATGTKIDGTDAVITLNGVEYKSKSSSFSINGMTITALDKTTSPVTLSTTTDTDGIYDMIKGLFTEYNKLINEMDALYNADAAKGYDPLTSEEKQELTDDEIEEWEKKVKDSLLRRDASLNSVSSVMKEVMLQGAEVNGRTLYLSDFGINTLGYFNAADNEKNAYHIDGDSDDTSVSGNKDKLKAMIASDPDTVMNFFTKLTNNMHDKLQEKMAAVKDTSSAFTFYNDKLLKKEYDEYTTKIKKQEDKVNALMDKWYAKFSAMETAMAKLQSKNNAISGMLGGG